MKPKHAFGLAVRVVGLIAALIGAYFLVCGLVLIIDPEYGVKLAPAWHFFVFGVADLLGGYCLIRGARRIVRFAYPDDSEE